MFGLSKKTLIIAAVVVVGFVLLMSFSETGEADANDGSGDCAFTVTADVLNVRDGPSRQAKVVGSLRNGKQVTALPEQKGGYRKLGDERWAAQKFLEPEGGAC